MSLFLISSPKSEWSLKKEKDGIKIYTRSFNGSSFNEFKGVTVIQNSSLMKVLDIILDVKNYDSLFPDCMNPEVLKQNGKWSSIHYIQTKGPLTLKDRDSIFEQKTALDKTERHALVTLNSLPNYIPEKKDIVRVREGTGFWEITEDGSENVTVVYQFHGEPGGGIPAWLVNSFVVSHPLKTLENLKERLKNK